MSIKTLHGIVIKGLCFLAILMPVCAQSTTANALQHPRDQIALQLGAIQMGYTVPFTLTGNISAPKMQQAVNALVMGRNSLNATVGAPAVQVQGVVDCPNVDTVEYRDQLYSAVEYVVTSPVVATIKGSATLANSKKVTLSTTKLTVPPSAWTIPVPYALEARSSADVEALSGNVTDLASQLASIGGNLTTTVSTISGLSGNLTNLSTQVSSIGGNLSNTAASVSTLSGNLTALANSQNTLSGNLTNLATQVSTISGNLTNANANAAAMSGNLTYLSYIKNALVSKGIIPDYIPSIVTTLAGSGSSGSADGTGTAASFGEISDFELGGDGTIYVADWGNRKIRKVTPTGVVTTLAGSNSYIRDGTGADAIFAEINDVKFDMNGDLIISDHYSIRKVTPAGVVTTLAGSGSPGSADGTGTAASFRSISSIVLDNSGNIYVADQGNRKIRKVTPAGVVTTLAGSGTEGSADGTGTEASFKSLSSIVLDISGNIYVSDLVNCNIRKVTPAGVVTTLAGSGTPGSADGTGIAASFAMWSIYSLVINGSGDIYVVDSGNYKIRKVTPAGVVTTLAGSGVAGSSDGIGANASFNGISNIVLDSSGNIYVADSGNYKIRKVTPAGVVTTLAGSGTAGSADGTGAAASFDGIYSVTLDGVGNIYVPDGNNRKIRKVTLAGVVTTLAGSGEWGSLDGVGSAAKFNRIYKSFIDNYGNVYFLEYSYYTGGFGRCSKIRKVTTDGVVTTIAGGGSPDFKDGTGDGARFSSMISDIEIDSTGNIYVADDGKIRKVTPAGVVTTLSGTVQSGLGYDGFGVLDYLSKMHLDISGNIYAVETGSSKIRKVTPAGVVSTLAGSGGSGSTDGTGDAATFGWVEISESDSFGNLYLADNDFNKIRKVTLDGVVTTLAGSGSAGSSDGVGANASFSGISSMALDGAGNIYVADWGNRKIREVTPAGVVTTLAGSGSVGSSDGDGPNASFNSISSMALDSSGNIYAADSQNYKIRKVTPAGVVTTLAGSGSSGSTDGFGYQATFGSNSGPIKVDAAGNVYVWDSANFKIRKITPQ